MAENFYTILTNIGMAAIANAQVSQSKVDFASIAVGDSNGSYYNPAATATKLVNEVWRGSINAISIDETNPNWIIVEAVIPATIGGFSVREIGVFDTSGALLAIGKIPETYKPAAEQGSLKDLYLRIILEVSNASSITLKVDPAVIYASKKYVDDKVAVVVSGLENVQQQLYQQTAAIDTKLDTHIKDDSGHVRYIGMSEGTNDISIVTNLIPMVDPSATTPVPKTGVAFRFIKHTTNTGNMRIQLRVDNNQKNTAYYPLLTSKGVQVKPGDFVNGGMYTVAFNGTNFIVQGEGGGYSVGETIRAMDVTNRAYIQTNVPVQNVGYYAYNAGAVATINGEEYAFARRNSTRDSQMTCWNVRTGYTMWRRSATYDWGTSIQVVGDRLYIGYFDYDNVVGGGVGLETMNALTGARIKTEKATVPVVGAANAVYNIAVTFNGPTKEITVLCGYGNGTYHYLCRYNLDGTFLASSADLKAYGLDENPFYITGVDTRTFVSSLKTIYMFGSVGLGYAGKTSAFPESYAIGGIAPNNTGGLCMLHTSGILYNYTTSLVAGPQLSIASNAVGLTTQGDRLGVVSSTTLSLYRFATDGSALYSEAAAVYQNDYNTSYPIKGLGVSENAFVVPTKDSKLEPPVLTRTLKILR